MLADSTIMSGSLPSFMTVYGEESTLFRSEDVDGQCKVDENAFPLVTRATVHPQHHPPTHAKPHQHRASISSSSFSESEDSNSPTTTSSTFDSPIVSDTSTSSSPESATSLSVANQFPATMFSKQGESMPAFTANDSQTANVQTAQTMQDTAKNVKKLTLDMNIVPLRRPATARALDNTHALSAPTSPLKEPMRSARKKPTNLSIRTPGYNQLTFPRTGTVPSTPSNRPSLHHMQSSPTLISLASPRAGPAGGMFLPLPSLNTQHSNHNSSSSNGSSFMTSSMPDLREDCEHMIPKSQEAPEPGYTEGPVCIYDGGVYLYLEPTATEARSFDTIINVAKEVKNPFNANNPEDNTVMSVWRSGPAPERNSIVEPHTAVSDFSFKSAWEWPQSEPTVSPTAATPTQSSFGGRPKEPEYLHVPWDHNSEILEDLYPLCKLIDARVAEGKKVLVHCQLGVSRSASLIIAYGLFKNYQPDFHAMYMTVKDRSRWVGPNMSLIYQLTDFKNKLNRGGFEDGSREPRPDWFVRSLDDRTTPTAANLPHDVSALYTKSTQINSTVNGVPDADKRKKPLELNKNLPPVPSFLNRDSILQLPLAPASAPLPPLPPPPPSSEPPEKQVTTSTVKRAASRPLPFREQKMQMTIPAHKPRIVPAFATVRSPSTVMDLAMQDVPSTPSLFSPRVREFRAVPFGICGAGDLETPGNRQSKELPSTLNFGWLPLRKDGHVRTASKDPRSPHRQDEAKEIFQSIDNFL